MYTGQKTDRKKTHATCAAVFCVTLLIAFGLLCGSIYFYLDNSNYTKELFIVHNATTIIKGDTICYTRTGYPSGSGVDVYYRCCPSECHLADPANEWFQAGIVACVVFLIVASCWVCHYCTTKTCPCSA